MAMVVVVIFNAITLMVVISDIAELNSQIIVYIFFTVMTLIPFFCYLGCLLFSSFTTRTTIMLWLIKVESCPSVIKGFE